MSRLYDDPARFAEEAAAGFVHSGRRFAMAANNVAGIRAVTSTDSFSVEPHDPKAFATVLDEAIAIQLRTVAS
jgi:hypothetical protein